MSTWGIVEYFAYPAMMFAATPIFIYTLGMQQYGLWMLLLTFVGLGGLGGLGMGVATTKDVSAARGSGHLTELVNTIDAGLMVALLSTAALATLLAGVGWFVGPDMLQKMGTPYLVRLTVIVAAILMIIEQVDSVATGALRGLERFDLSAKVEAAAKLLVVLMTLFAAVFTGDIKTVYAAAIVMTAVRLLIKLATVRALLGRFPRPSWDQTRMRSAFRFGKWMWLQALGAAFFATADRVIVGSLLGASSLAAYSVCLHFAQQVHSVPAAAAQFLFPTVSRRIAGGEGFRDLAFRGSVIIALFAVAISLPSAIFSFEILEVWVGSDIAKANYDVLRILLLGFTVLALSNGPHFILLGLGRARLIAAVNIAAGLVAVAFASIAIPQFDLAGAAAARVCFGVVVCALIYEVRKIGVQKN